MKHIQYLLLTCIVLTSLLLSSCLAHRTIRTERESILPAADQYIGKTVWLIADDAPGTSSQVQLDSIGEESEESYKARYTEFKDHSPNRDTAIGLGIKVYLSPWVAETLRDSTVFAGYAPSGILTKGSKGVKLNDYWSYDSITEIETGKSFSEYRIHDLISSNTVPVRGMFYFTENDNPPKHFSMTNTAFADLQFDRPITAPIPPEPPTPVVQESSQENSEPSIGSEIVGGFFNALFSGLFSSGSSDDHKDSALKNDDSKNKKDDSNSNTKKGRINSGEQRGRK